MGQDTEARELLDRLRDGDGSARDRLIALAQAHPDWALGFADEVWWSRLAQPQLHSWTDQPLRLVEQTVAKGDPDPKARACYGVWLRRTGQAEQVWRRWASRCGR